MPPVVEASQQAHATVVSLECHENIDLPSGENATVRIGIACATDWSNPYLCLGRVAVFWHGSHNLDSAVRPCLPVPALDNLPIGPKPERSKDLVPAIGGQDSGSRV